MAGSVGGQLGVGMVCNPLEVDKQTTNDFSSLSLLVAKGSLPPSLITMIMMTMMMVVVKLRFFLILLYLLFVFFFLLFICSTAKTILLFSFQAHTLRIINLSMCMKQQG